MMSKRTELWFKSLAASVVSGAANAVVSSFGITAANLVGVSVQPLSLKQTGSVAISGAIVGLVLYLKQSPVPPDSGDTTTISKP